MSISLRDQLTQLGFKASAVEKPAAERKPRPADGGKRRDGEHPRSTNTTDSRESRRGKAQRGPQAGATPAASDSRARARGAQPAGKARRGSEMDLGKAYAMRAQKEKEERIEAERLKQEAARLRREARARLAEFLRDKGLNDPDAELTRHFEYGGKIKRVHVNAAQLKALNAGELGVVQNEGRYLLVTAAVLAEAEQLFAPAIALKVDPDAPAADDPYADPKYQVPDDLVW